MTENIPPQSKAELLHNARARYAQARAKYAAECEGPSLGNTKLKLLEALNDAERELVAIKRLVE